MNLLCFLVRFITIILIVYKNYSLDATSTLQGNHVLGIGFMLWDGESEEMGSIIVNLAQRENRDGAVADAEYILKRMEKIFGSDFTEIAKKIKFVASDNCNEANLIRDTIIRKLNQQYPIGQNQTREAIRCSGLYLNHFCATLF